MTRFLTFLWVVCQTSAALADGTIQGVLTLEPMFPPAPRPGYVPPPTKKPVQKPEVAPAIVYLERKEKNYPPLRVNEKIVLRQEGYQFRPNMVVLQKGAVVAFPNLDDEFHNVVSVSRPNGFDLGRYRNDEPVPEERFKPGLIRVYCDIHSHMRCLILVLETPWFTKTDAKGAFTLSKIPAGDYTLKVLQPSEKKLEQPVKVLDGKTTTVRFTR